MNKTPHVAILGLSVLVYCSSQMPPPYEFIMFFLLTIIQIKCVFEIMRTDKKRKAPFTVPVRLEVNNENPREA